MKEGTFREDLFYRLNVVTITIPPLRTRREDVPPLIDHFLRHVALEGGKEVQGISPRAMDLLLKYDYPGNVRELENIIERAVVITRGSVISDKDLPFSGESFGSGQNAVMTAGALRESVEALERTLIQKAMEQSLNHQTKAANLLGISERMLRYKLKKYGLK